MCEAMGTQCLAREAPTTRHLLLWQDSALGGQGDQLCRGPGDQALERSTGRPESHVLCGGTQPLLPVRDKQCTKQNHK